MPIHADTDLCLKLAACVAMAHDMIALEQAGRGLRSPAAYGRGFNLGRMRNNAKIGRGSFTVIALKH